MGSDSSTATRASSPTSPSLDFLIGKLGAGIISFTSKGGCEAQTCTWKAPSTAPGTLRCPVYWTLFLVKVFKKATRVAFKKLYRDQKQMAIRKRALPDS